MHKLIGTAALATLLAAPAFADITAGGWGQIEYDWEDYDGDSEPRRIGNFRGEILGGYETDQFTIALGASAEYDEWFNEDVPFDSELELDVLFLAGYGPVTFTYGHFYGAGTMIGEDYFGMNDSTSRRENTFRLDYIGEYFDLAISYSDDGDSDSSGRHYEIGVATQFMDHFIRAAYELRMDGADAETKDFGIIIGRDLGRFEYHLAASLDFQYGGYSDQIGGSLFYDVTDSFNIGGNIAFSPSEGIHSYGLLGIYEFGGANLKVEYVHEPREDADDNFTTFELGLHVPFGKPQRAEFNRQANKEFLTAFGFSRYQQGKVVAQISSF